MRYEAGQVWAYHSRPGEEWARLTVLRVDDEPGYGPIVHVALSGLRLRSPHAPDGLARVMSHAPLTVDAVDRSVTELVETLPPPDAGEGYAVWRAAFEKGEAGVFTLTAAEIVIFCEQAMNRSG